MADIIPIYFKGFKSVEIGVKFDLIGVIVR